MQVQPHPRKKVTCLYYMDGKNNLSSMANHALRSIAKEGSDENINLVAEVGLKDQDVYRGEPGNGTKLLDVEELGKVDMGSVASVKDFVKWGMEKYPADQYVLVLWDHGAGFKGVLTDDLTNKEKALADYKTQCGDSLVGKLKYWSHKTWESLKSPSHGSVCNNRELASALEQVQAETGQKIGVLNFNACLMSQAEVAYEYRQAAENVVGSQEIEIGLKLPIPGLYGTTPQHKVIQDLKQAYQGDGKLSNEEIAKLFVYEAKHQPMSRLFTATQSAIKTAEMEGLHSACENLAGQLIQALEKEPEKVDSIRDLIRHTQHYANIDAHLEPYSDYRDLGDFTRRLMGAEQLPEAVKAAAGQVQEAYKKAVICEQHHPVNQVVGASMEGSTGLSCYLPVDYGYDRPTENGVDGVVGGGTHGYDKTSWGENSQWERFLKQISRDDDTLGRFPKINKQLVNLGQVSRISGYSEVLGVLNPQFGTWGAWPLQGFPWIIPLPGPALAAVATVGSGLRIGAGLKNLSEAWQREDSPNRVDMAVKGAIDVALGTGVGITSAAAMVGMASNPAVQGVALGSLGLAGGNLAWNALQGWQESQKNANLTVAEKLARADAELKPHLG